MSLPGTLFIVATPIGNREDLTPRAMRVLREADLIAAEDTRAARKILDPLDIRRPLASLHEHNEAARARGLLEALKAGQSVALITEAGTPTVSDPGFRLVRAAAEAGIRVVPVPGPSAVLAALSASGLPTDRFAFEGFLPPRAAARRARLRELARDPRTLVFFESPHRVRETLADMADILGARPCAVARELTKVHEEILRATLAEARDAFSARAPIGEFTLVVGGAPEAPAAPEEVLRAVREAIAEGRSVREAAARAAAETGASRRETYRLALEEAARRGT